MKNTKSAAIVVLALLLATAGFAGQQRGGSRDGSGPLIDTATLTTYQGTVVQLVAGLGQGLPELEVITSDGQAMSFVLGPFWYLQASGFAAAAGDLVEVQAYACTTCESGLAVASVDNLTRNLVLSLRGEDGTPLWISRGSRATGHHSGRGGNGGSSENGNGGTTNNGNGGSTNTGQGTPGGDGPGNGSNHNGPGQGTCEECETPDLGAVSTFVGTVASFLAEPAAGTPSVTLATSDGDVTILLSPMSMLLRAGFELAVGQMLEITAAPVEHDGAEAWLALVVKDSATGLTVVLRDPSTGLPPTGRGRR